VKRDIPNWMSRSLQGLYGPIFGSKASLLVIQGRLMHEIGQIQNFCQKTWNCGKSNHLQTLRGLGGELLPYGKNWWKWGANAR